MTSRDGGRPEGREITIVGRGHEQFEELLERIAPHMRRLASRTAVDPRTADEEDLFQEMAVHLWERWRKGALAGKSDAYIVRGCWFHLLNFLRRLRAREEMVSLESLGEEAWRCGAWMSSRSFPSDEEVETAVLQRMADEVGLTERERMVAELLLQGYTLREVAQKLGVSHVRVLRIRRNIARKFEQGGYQLRRDLTFIGQEGDRR